MQHRTDGSGNIRHIVRLGAFAMLDAPTHKQARNMDVIWIPCTVGSSLAAVIIVVTRLQDNLDTSAALTVVAVDGTELQFCRNALDRGLLHVEGIVHVLVLLQSVYYHLLDGCVIQTEFFDDVCIEEYLIVHNGLY